MNEELPSNILTIRYKIVFVGDPGIGKTSVLKRFVNNDFNEKHDATIGVDFATKQIDYKDNSIKLQIWDSAGQERYKSLIPSYVRGSSIIFILYDISRKETFNNLKKWIGFIKEFNTESSILVLCGNKIDLNREVLTDDGKKLAKDENIELFFETSAKENINISKMMYSCIAELPFFQQFNDDKNVIIEDLIKNNKFNDESNVINNEDKNKKNNIINNYNNYNLGNNDLKNENNKFQIDTENNTVKGNKKNCICK